MFTSLIIYCNRLHKNRFFFFETKDFILIKNDKWLNENFKIFKTAEEQKSLKLLTK